MRREEPALSYDYLEVVRLYAGVSCSMMGAREMKEKMRATVHTFPELLRPVS